MKSAVSKRCRVWRPLTPPAGHPTGHLPGTCRTCWGLCRRPTIDGRLCCDECADLLSQHREPRVRLALIEEGLASDDLVELMVDDGDALVADAAAHWMATRLRPPLPVPDTARTGGDANE